METWNVFRKRPYIRMQRAQYKLSIAAWNISVLNAVGYVYGWRSFLRRKTNLDSRLCSRPVFPPSTQQIILLEQYLLVYLSKKTVLYFYRIKVFTKPVFEVYREPVLTKPWRLTNGLVLYQTRPSGLVSFSFELGILVGSSHGDQRIPISRQKPIHTWLALPGIIWLISVGRTLQNVILWLKNRKIRFPFHS